MATRNTRPPLKHTPFTELQPDGTQFVTNSWYDWALNLTKAIDTITTRVTVIEDDLDDPAGELQRLLKADVAVFAPQMLPTITGGCDPLLAIEFDPAKPNLVALPFQPNVDTSADFHEMLPFSWAGKTFSIWVYWGHGGSGTAWDVAWEVTSNATFDDESLVLDFLPGVLVTDTGGTAGNLYIARLSSIPIASYENEEGSLVSLRITRRGTYTEDTMDIPAYLLAVRFVLEDTEIVAPVPATGELYLRFEGDFTDSSVAARTVSSFSSPALSTAHPGGGSEGMVGNGAGYLTVVDDGAFDIGDRLFQIRFHLYITSAASLATDNIIIGKWGASDGSWFVGLNGGTQRLNWGQRTTGSYNFYSLVDAVVARDTLMQVTIWRHTVGGQIRCALDGIVQTAGSAGGDFDTSTNNLAIGAVVGGGAPLPAGVYVDELQFKIDETEYTTANFTPPTPPYT